MIATPIRIANPLGNPLKADFDPYAMPEINFGKTPPGIIELNSIGDVLNLIAELNLRRVEAEERYNAEQRNKAALLKESMRTLDHIMYHAGYREESRRIAARRIEESAHTHPVP